MKIKFSNCRLTFNNISKYFFQTKIDYSLFFSTFPRISILLTSHFSFFLTRWEICVFVCSNTLWWSPTGWLLWFPDWLICVKFVRSIFRLVYIRALFSTTLLYSNIPWWRHVFYAILNAFLPPNSNPTFEVSILTDSASSPSRFRFNARSFH